MDSKCQNGDEEWVFDQVSEAGREQTHCHTYQFHHPQKDLNMAAASVKTLLAQKEKQKLTELPHLMHYVVRGGGHMQFHSLQHVKS